MTQDHNVHQPHSDFVTADIEKAQQLADAMFDFGAEWATQHRLLPPGMALAAYYLWSHMVISATYHQAKSGGPKMHNMLQDAFAELNRTLQEVKRMEDAS